MVSGHLEPRRSASPWSAGWECEPVTEELPSPGNFPVDADRNRMTSPWSRCPIAARDAPVVPERILSKIYSKPVASSSGEA